MAFHCASRTLVVCEQEYSCTCTTCTCFNYMYSVHVHVHVCVYAIPSYDCAKPHRARQFSKPFKIPVTTCTCIYMHWCLVMASMMLNNIHDLTWPEIHTLYMYIVHTCIFVAQLI